MTQGTQSLITVQERPFNAETPLPALCAPITPTDLFFVRSNFDTPHIDAATWSLSCAGLFTVPQSFSLARLQRFARREVTTTLECAGNGRRLMQPVPKGTAWEYGAVSTARFAGIALRDVLTECGLRADAAVELVFRAADSGAVDQDRVVHFERSLPLARALHPDTLLVWEMNGEPLTVAHGHPVRLLVPGFYGVASVKWLTGIEAVATPFAGHFQSERYIYDGHPRYDAGTPVTQMHVRALIAEPANDETVKGTVVVRGAAWSGFGRIERVLVSTDGGATWESAKVTSPASPYAAAQWEYEWTPAQAGSYELMVRAQDSTGALQPLEPIWNELGYGNNVVQRISVHVVQPMIPLAG